jgi:SHS2 domain-containing protein
MRQVNVAGKYGFLDHTADIKIESFGKSLPESFSNLGLGIMSVLIDPAELGESVTQTTDKNIFVEKEIHIQSERISSLLYDFIDELLYFIDTEQLVVLNFNHMTIKRKNSDEFELICSIRGVMHNVAHQSPFKSPTYNEMVLEMDDDTKKFRLQVVIDI